MPFMLILFFLPSICFAATNPFEIPAVKSYNSKLELTLQSKNRQSIEPLFTKAEEASHDLAPIIESMDRSTFEKLQSQLQGIILRRTEVLVAEPDRDFFLKLSVEKGTKVDRSFFTLSVKTKPGGWPVYIKQQTDYSGCVRYGENTLVNLYEEWGRFAKEFRKSYQTHTSSEITRIGTELTNATCACDGKESAISEFKAFITAFPTSPISKKLADRIAAIENGKSDIRFNCISG